MSAPVVMALRTSCALAPMARLATLPTTLWMVSDMFVPVSPSGTGNTFRRLTSSLRSSSVLAAAATAFRILLEV